MQWRDDRCVVRCRRHGVTWLHHVQQSRMFASLTLRKPDDAAVVPPFFPRVRGPACQRMLGMTAKERVFPDRKQPVHLPAVESRNRSIIIFLTVCTKNRKRVLATAGRHRALLKAWGAADNYLVGRYVIMPDHLHLFCAPASAPPASFKQWLRYWKSLAARQADLREGLWQREYWDTQLRKGEDYEAKWRYVRENPVRAGLTGTPAEWPYQGEIHRLEWDE